MGQHTCPVSQVGFVVLCWLRCVCISFLIAQECHKTFITREFIDLLGDRPGLITQKLHTLYAW